MADPECPTTIPTEFEQSDYSETPISNLSSFQPDVGPPSTIHRSTLKRANVQGSLILTQTERESFFTFFQDTLADGSLPFT